MCQLLETIKCKDGILFNLEFHQERFNFARQDCFSCSDKIILSNEIQIPNEYRKGLFRCRVLYSQKIEKIEFLPHQFKKVESLKLVKADKIDYQFKYSDRNELNELFIKRGECDDILIVKGECITDSFSANTIFHDGEKWWTSDTPLLRGTQRERLIFEHNLFVTRITIKDLSKYKKVGLINALQDLDDMPIVDIKNVF